MLPERCPRPGCVRPPVAIHSSTGATPEPRRALQSFLSGTARCWVGLVALTPCSPIARSLHPPADRKGIISSTGYDTARHTFLDGIRPGLLRPLSMANFRLIVDH